VNPNNFRSSKVFLEAQSWAFQECYFRGKFSEMLHCATEKKNVTLVDTHVILQLG
jgi:hypothetical protein